MTRPDRDPVQPAREIPLPLQRRGIPAAPRWLLAILSALSAATVAVGLAYMAGSLPLSDTVMELISVIMGGLLLVFLFRILRTQRWLTPLLLLLGMAQFSLTGSFLLAAMLISLLAAIGFSAVLLAVSERETLTRLAFIPLAAYGLALVLCRDPLLSLVALVPFPAAAALALSTRAASKREDAPGRVGIICLTSLCLGAATLALVALLLYRHLGSLSPAHLRDWLEGLRSSMAHTLMDTTQQLADLFAAEGQTSPIAVLTEAQALDAVNSVINLCPGLAVVLCNISAALAQGILLGELAAFGYGESVKGRVRLFRMSLMSGVVFLVACIVTLITASGESLAGTVAENIFLILEPGLLLAGILRFSQGMLRRRQGCLVFLLLPLLVAFAAPLVAAYGALAPLLSALLAKLKPPADPPEDGGDRPE